MKAKKNELEVDFIGGAKPLTKEEEKRVSDFIKNNKEKQGFGAMKKRQKSRASKK